MSDEFSPDERIVRAVAPWFGAARMIAPRVGEELRGCNWVGVPFAGGMSELAEIEARTLVVSDLHKHVINLARVIARPLKCQELVKQLRRIAFHASALREAQIMCSTCEPDPGDDGNVAFAVYYFTCCWMGRSHKAGTVDEFNGGISTRWNSNGGDSVVRYRSALRAIVHWQKVMRRCAFLTLDCFEFLPKCLDEANTGIYCDPPFPGPGEKYRHTFTRDQHAKLAATLRAFTQARVVCRFYDHPLIRELYAEQPGGIWFWRRLKGRTQTNQAAPEVLVMNGPSRTPMRTQGLFDPELGS